MYTVLLKPIPSYAVSITFPAAIIVIAEYRAISIFFKNTTLIATIIASITAVMVPVLKLGFFFFIYLTTISLPPVLEWLLKTITFPKPTIIPPVIEANNLSPVILENFSKTFKNIDNDKVPIIDFIQNFLLVIPKHRKALLQYLLLHQKKAY